MAKQKINDQQQTTGSVVQFAYVQYADIATGTTVIPQDDTIPQITEGDQYMTLSVTPKSATNTLEVEVNIFVSTSAAGAVMTAALFKDSTANALAATSNFHDVSAQYSTRPLFIRYIMTAGTTSAIAFKVRAGAHNAGTTTFNGVNAQSRYGAAVKSTITIKEYKV